MSKLRRCFLDLYHQLEEVDTHFGNIRVLSRELMDNRTPWNGNGVLIRHQFLEEYRCHVEV